MDEGAARRRSRARFLSTVIGLLVVGVAGYAGFVALAGSDRNVSAGVMALAAGTGFAAFFSPCSFPLLLTFLTRRSADSRRAGLVSALRVAAGAALLLAAMASVITVGGVAVGRIVEFDSPTGRVFRFGVGALLILLGLRQARIVGWRMGWLDAMASRSARAFDPAKAAHRAGGDLMYGFGYLLAGFG